MTAVTSLGTPRSSIRGDALIGALAWSAASAGVILNGRAAWIALAVLALPAAAFVFLGYLAGRGGVMACLVSAIGAAILSGPGGCDPASAVLILGLLVSVATFGGLAAERRASPISADVPERPWMTIVVEHQGTLAFEARPATEITSRRPQLARTS